MGLGAAIRRWLGIGDTHGESVTIQEICYTPSSDSRVKDVRDMKRIDIISDTHGRLSRSLLASLEGADLIIHAGDITSEADWEMLQTIAPIHAVLGNNDTYYYKYEPALKRLNTFEYEGLTFAVSHYREDLPVGAIDVGVCGHTHRARIAEQGRCLVINPGSATSPRDSATPTMARMYVAEGAVQSVKIIKLESAWA